MKKTISASHKIITAILFTALMLGMAYMQAHLKQKPQLTILGLGFLTVVLFYINLKKAATILFAILLALLLYCNSFIAFDAITKLLGQNDPLGLSAIIFSFLFALITLLFYFRKYPRERDLEKLFSVLFFLSFVLVYIIYEL